MFRRLGFEYWPLRHLPRPFWSWGRPPGGSRPGANATRSDHIAHWRAFRCRPRRLNRVCRHCPSFASPPSLDVAVGRSCVQQFWSETKEWRKNPVFVRSEGFSTVTRAAGDLFLVDQEKLNISIPFPLNAQTWGSSTEMLFVSAMKSS